jgi:hypothetical protein
MSEDQQSALRHLAMAKQSVKDAFTMLEPGAEPYEATGPWMAALKALDAIDSAINKIKESGNVSA